MAYDLEKYREKREKVLGVKKRGIGFGTMSMIVSMAIVVGLGLVVIPKSIAYFHARHLDDAIYKLQDGKVWSHEIISQTRKLDGVKGVERNDNGSRIVVTFNRSITDTAKLSSFYKRKGLSAVLLNKVSHSQRMHIMKKEAEFETL